MPAIAPATIDGLSQLADIDVDTIVKYEGLGLMPKPRLRSGRRTSTPYHQEHLDRLNFIRRALALGFSLEAVADLLGVRGGMRTCGDIYLIANRQLEEIRQRIAHLQQIEQQLAPLVEACPRIGDARGCPIWQALQEHPKQA
ncbi:MerR family transcriptional regulator, mercuric resistance operon regulatory protein [Enhydrobacter aerosaccus]|uniref:MerR family transcriptional regulator, mercuric resistance operon regulatory protein n=1 Tax=Enhydrobacter aerosaccus TaxID=225324 RepID=A0A1T4SSJ4_9HYPH|nr:MerR family DNA-binding protein [Enhydrobacter aerosaccus]SKA30848.1 MerR family transcriptional regulator, mercuric resistance operon regulatory protein [Enhydrobacter aerosaccus]